MNGDIADSGNDGAAGCSPAKIFFNLLALLSGISFLAVGSMVDVFGIAVTLIVGILLISGVTAFTAAYANKINDELDVQTSEHQRRSDRVYLAERVALRPYYCNAITENIQFAYATAYRLIGLEMLRTHAGPTLSACFSSYAAIAVCEVAMAFLAGSSASLRRLLCNAASVLSAAGIVLTAVGFQGASTLPLLHVAVAQKLIPLAALFLPSLSVYGWNRMARTAAGLPRARRWLTPVLIAGALSTVLLGGVALNYVGSARASSATAAEALASESGAAGAFTSIPYLLYGLGLWGQSLRLVDDQNWRPGRWSHTIISGVVSRVLIASDFAHAFIIACVSIIGGNMIPGFAITMFYAWNHPNPGRMAYVVFFCFSLCSIVVLHILMNPQFVLFGMQETANASSAAHVLDELRSAVQHSMASVREGVRESMHETVFARLVRRTDADSGNNSVPLLRAFAPLAIEQQNPQM